MDDEEPVPPESRWAMCSGQAGQVRRLGSPRCAAVHSRIFRFFCFILAAAARPCLATSITFWS